MLFKIWVICVNYNVWFDIFQSKHRVNSFLLHRMQGNNPIENDLLKCVAILHRYR